MSRNVSTPGTKKSVTKPTSTKARSNKPIEKSGRNTKQSDLAVFEGLSAAQYDLSGNLVDATEQFIELFELPKNYKQSANFSESLRTDQYSFEDCWEDNSNNNDKKELARKTAKGKPIWTRSQFLTLKNSKGQTSSVIELAQNVTEEVNNRLDQNCKIQAIQNSQAVIEYDLDGRIRTANENFLNVVGYQLNEVVGKHHRLFVDETEANAPEYSAFWDSLRRGECKQGEFRRKSKDGKDVWIQAYCSPVIDAAGNAYKVVEFASDITARKSSQNDLMKAMLTNMAASITFADANNVIQYINPAAENLLRKVEQFLPVRADKILGQSIDIFHKNPNHQRAVIADKRNFPFKGTIQIGQEYFVLNASRILNDKGDFVGTLVSWECVTEKISNEKLIHDNNERERRQAQELQEKVAVVLENVNAMADGNFDVAVPDLGNDAIGQVGAALNQAILAINEALKEVRQVAGTVSTAAEQLSAVSRDISAGAQTQASSLEETASSLEEITSTVKQNTDNAQQARQLAVGSRDVAEKGGEVVGDAVKGMGEINHSSKKIADIITTIDEIAFQTNLLALNAAVEAARAGDQGRGFAVVASEVRNLAQRSASAAKEIKALIQDSVRKVEVGTDLVNRSGGSLSDIVNSVKRVTDIVAEIAAASKEQLTGIEQVNKAVSQMDRITQSNAAQTEEMSGTAESLLGHARQLSDLVSRFKLLGGDDSALVRSTKPKVDVKQPAMTHHERPSQGCPINFNLPQANSGTTILEF